MLNRGFRFLHLIRIMKENLGKRKTESKRKWRYKYTLERRDATRSSGPVRTSGLETETEAEIVNGLWRRW